jgi:hypothetical protein
VQSLEHSASAVPRRKQLDWPRCRSQSGLFKGLCVRFDNMAPTAYGLGGKETPEARSTSQNARRQQRPSTGDESSSQCSQVAIRVALGWLLHPHSPLLTASGLAFSPGSPLGVQCTDSQSSKYYKHNRHGTKSRMRYRAGPDILLTLAIGQQCKPH